MSSSTVYLLFLIGEFHRFLIALAGFCFLFVLLYGIIFFLLFIDGDYNFDDTQTEEKMLKFMVNRVKNLFAVVLVLLAVSLFIPTTKQVLAIYGVPKVVNSTVVKKTTNKLYIFVNSWLKHEAKQINQGVLK